MYLRMLDTERGGRQWEPLRMYVGMWVHSSHLCSGSGHGGGVRVVADAVGMNVYCTTETPSLPVAQPLA